MARFTTHQGAPASCPGYAAERSEATQCGFLQTWPSEAHGLRNGAHRPGIWEFAVLALRLHIRIVKRNLLCILIFPKAWNMKQVQTVVYLIYSFYILIDIGYKVLEIVFYHFFVNWGDRWHGTRDQTTLGSGKSWGLISNGEFTLQNCPPGSPAYVAPEVVLQKPYAPQFNRLGAELPFVKNDC